MNLHENFDPASARAALQLMQAELRDVLHGPPSAGAHNKLPLLRQDLASVTRRARAWAERQAIVVQLPHPPADNAGPAECAHCLELLTQALAGLGDEAAPPASELAPLTDATVRAVVRRLRQGRAGAIRELEEFARVLREALEFVETLDRALGELHAGIASILLVDGERDRLQALCRIEESSARAHSSSEQIVMSFRQIHGVLKTWDVGQGCVA